MQTDDTYWLLMVHTEEIEILTVETAEGQTLQKFSSVSSVTLNHTVFLILSCKLGPPPR